MPNNTLEAQNKILTKALKRIMRSYKPDNEYHVVFVCSLRKIARDAIREVERVEDA